MLRTKPRKKILSSIAFMCIVFMITMLLPEKITSAKTKDKVIEITNPVTALTVGSTYKLKVSVTPKEKNEKITWKTSNSRIATVDNKGKVTAKKSGNVVIAAYTKSGERAACRISIVPKNGVTDSVYTFGQMLKSEQCNKITLRQLEKKWNYVIDEGDYSKKTLTLDIPKSHLDNHGVFKKITIDAIGNDTYYEYAKGNRIYINDLDTSIEVTENAEVKLMKVCKAKSSLKLKLIGTMEQLAVTGKESTVRVYGAGKLDKLFVTKGAKNSDIILRLPTNIVMHNDGKITVKQGAEGTTIEVPNNKIKVTVDNQSKLTVELKNLETGEVTKFYGSEDKPVDPPTPPTPPTPPSTKTEKLVGKVAEDGKEITYTLPVEVEKVKALEVSFDEGESYKLGPSMIKVMDNIVNDKDKYADFWYGIKDIKVEKDGTPIEIKGDENSWEKNVTIAGKEFAVTVDQATKVLNVKHNGKEYSFALLGNMQIKMESLTESDIEKALSLIATY